MKTSTRLAVAAVAIAFLLTALIPAESRDDIRVIKKAVRENPNYRPANAVKWFKVLITDDKVNKDVLRITLPIFVVRAFAKCADGENIHVQGRDLDFNFADLLEDLTKAGPLALLEICENGETVKVWLE